MVFLKTCILFCINFPICNLFSFIISPSYSFVGPRHSAYSAYGPGGIWYVAKKKVQTGGEQWKQEAVMKRR
jgi:hypothetical protein